MFRVREVQFKGMNSSRVGNKNKLPFSFDLKGCLPSCSPVEDFLDLRRELVERDRDNRASSGERGVLVCCGLTLTARTGSSVAELYLRVTPKNITKVHGVAHHDKS